VELQANLAKIREQQLGLAAISYDSPAVLKNFAGRTGITFPLLSDTGSKVIREWGMLNENVAANTPQFGIPHPGTFILDGNGVVVSRFFESDFRERYTASEILVRQFGAAPGSPQTEMENRHLKLVNSASLAAAKWGQRIALVLDVDLKPGMHVYAPGVQGYIAVDWSMAESPAVKVHEATYPASQQINLPAIHETVPAYKGKFQIVRDVTIGTDAQVKPALNEKGELIIHGTFRYQACDDRTCYIPETLPLAWTVRYEGLDRQRAPAELQRKAPGK